MQKIFRKILVPLPFNAHTNSIVEKAIGFGNQLGCDLHIVHVMPETFLSRLFTSSKKNDKNKFRLAEIQRYVRQHLAEGIECLASLYKGNREQVLRDYVLGHEIDTILFHACRNRFWYSHAALSINKLANETSCFILTFRSNAIFEGIKTIVLPIDDSLPINKIRVATYLAKRFHASIHLVAINDGPAQTKHSYLKKAFQVLKDNTDLDIVCRSLHDGLYGSKLFQYAQSVDAGLIISDPGTTAASPTITYQKYRSAFNIPVITVA